MFKRLKYYLQYRSYIDVLGDILATAVVAIVVSIAVVCVTFATIVLYLVATAGFQHFV